jgi:hypothetical protein
VVDASTFTRDSAGTRLTIIGITDRSFTEAHIRSNFARKWENRDVDLAMWQVEQSLSGILSAANSRHCRPSNHLESTVYASLVRIQNGQLGTDNGAIAALSVVLLYSRAVNQSSWASVIKVHARIAKFGKEFDVGHGL